MVPCENKKFGKDSLKSCEHILYLNFFPPLNLGGGIVRQSLPNFCPSFLINPVGMSVYFHIELRSFFSQLNKFTIGLIMQFITNFVLLLENIIYAVRLGSCLMLINTNVLTLYEDLSNENMKGFSELCTRTPYPTSKNLCRGMRKQPLYR